MGNSPGCRVVEEEESPMVYYKNWFGLAVVSSAIASVLAVLFWKRRRIQPIQARHPGFVMITACSSILWVVVLCLSRIYQHDFPCVLYLWSAYIGSIVLLNMFMLRTFFLYADFNWTQFMIAARERYTERLQEERKKKVEKFLKELDPGLSSSVSRLSMNKGVQQMKNSAQNGNSKHNSAVPERVYSSPAWRLEEQVSESQTAHTNGKHHPARALSAGQLPPQPSEPSNDGDGGGSGDRRGSRSPSPKAVEDNASDVALSSLCSDSALEQSTSYVTARTPSVRTRERTASTSRSRSTMSTTGRIKVKHGNGRKMSISLQRSDNGYGDETSLSLAAGMTLYVDVDVKRLNKTLWRRVHQYLLRESPIKYLFMLSCLLLLAPAIDTGRSETLRCWIGDQCLRQWEGTAAVLAVFAGLYAVGFVVIGMRIRKVRDTYGIRNELSGVGCVGIFCLPPWYILNNINSEGVENFNDETSFSTLILVFMICVTILLSLAVPLYNSYETIPYIKKSSKVIAEVPDVEELKNCEACLRNERARKVFEHHLVDSFAVQHLHCWLDLQLFKNMVTKAETGDVPKGALSEFQNEMHRLYLYYIKEQSPEQINIGAHLRRQLWETTEKIKSEAFLNDDNFMTGTRGCDGDAEEFAKLPVAAKKMRNAYQARWRMAESQVLKLLRDQYKFFRRTKRFETFITELDADQKARLFAGGANGGAMLQGADLQLETIRISSSVPLNDEEKSDNKPNESAGSGHTPLVTTPEPSMSASRQSFDV